VRSVALLRTGGVLVMEHDHEQGALLRAAALGAGFKQAETGQDLTGRDRYLRAVR
jgi:protein-(glutamine-N5) methyltransferase, release factor-specific